MKNFNPVVTVELSIDSLESVSTNQLTSIFELAWHSDKVAGTQYQNLHNAYILFHGDDYKPMLEAQWLMDKAITAFNRDRLELVRAYDDEEGITDKTKLTDIPGMGGIKRAWDSARRACAQYASRLTFNTVGRLTAVQILNGVELVAEIDATGYEAKADTQETAKAKPASKKAEGATVATAEGGATALESITGTFDEAKNAVLACIAKYPRLALSPEIIEAFNQAHTTASKAVAIAKAKKSKAKKAA